ncbi:MAG: DUF2268 domain-containing putative Zn-dependent protease [Bacteroidota bacterium]
MINSNHFFKILCACLVAFSSMSAQESDKKGLSFTYVENTETFSENEKQLIEETITETDKDLRELLPELPQNIEVILAQMSRDLEVVGGTTGRAEKHDPDGEVYIYISNVFPGGIKAAVKTSLVPTIYHEFHHLARGWTMIGNKFDRGIDIAMVNEGLAVVFSEHYTQKVFEGNSIPKDVESWVEEVLALPQDANYNTWMNQHPDGRFGIGYRAGNYVVRKAIKQSKKDILELSMLSPEEILELAGYYLYRNTINFSQSLVQLFSSIKLRL